VQVTYEWIVNDTLDLDYNCFVHGTHASATGVDHIVFQGDHGLPKPASQWRKGDVIVDGPHELRVSSQHDQYDLVIGLFKGERIPLKGPDQGGNRILLARLKCDRQDGRITNISAEKITAATQPPADPRQADFAAHTNPAGTWIDFGSVATDGALKINREPNRLVIFPYPRDHGFKASLDLKALVSGSEPARARVRALAAGTQADLGLVEAALQQGRLVFNLATPGAGRYVVTWGN
jgi:hypothetical protein